jgi:DNA-binding NtrC family response regulator
MMVYFDIEASVASGAIVARHPAPVSRLACVPGYLSSLVLSADAAVRRRLEAATELAGWSICDTPAEGDEFDGVADNDYQLVIVDLAHPLDGNLAVAQRAAERIAGRPETLLVVCGDADSIDHEIWSRCQGAFCHLAGDVSGDALVSLLNKARATAHRHTSRTVRCGV